jgi:hypothetical protein
MKKNLLILFIFLTLDLFGQKDNSIFVALGVSTPSYVPALRGIGIEGGYSRYIFTKFGFTTTAGYSKFNYPFYDYYSENGTKITYDLSQYESQYLFDATFFALLRNRAKKLNFKLGLGLSLIHIKASTVPLLLKDAQTGDAIIDTRVIFNQPYVFFNNMMEIDYRVSHRFSVGIKGMGRMTAVFNQSQNPSNYTISNNRSGIERSATQTNSKLSLFSNNLMLKTSYWF